MPIPFTLEELRAATHELIAANGLTRVLHPADRLPRLRPDGALPARRAGRGLDRRLAVGRVPRRGGQAARHPGQGLELAADLARRADPARQGLGPVPEQRAGQDRGLEGRLPGGDPARLAAASSARARARTSTSIRDGQIADSAPDGGRSSTASAATRSSRSPRTSGTRWSSATSPAPSCTSPTRCSCPGTAAELVPVREIDDHMIGTGEPGPVTRELQRVFDDALHGRDAALHSSGSTS